MINNGEKTGGVIAISVWRIHTSSGACAGTDLSSRYGISLIDLDNITYTGGSALEAKELSHLRLYSFYFQAEFVYTVWHIYVYAISSTLSDNFLQDIL